MSRSIVTRLDHSAGPHGNLAEGLIRQWNADLQLLEWRYFYDAHVWDSERMLHIEIGNVFRGEGDGRVARTRALIMMSPEEGEALFWLWPTEGWELLQHMSEFSCGKASATAGKEIRYTGRSLLDYEVRYCRGVPRCLNPAGRIIGRNFDVIPGDASDPYGPEGGAISMIT